MAIGCTADTRIACIGRDSGAWGGETYTHAMAGETLNLKQVALRLGAHYTTVYRYVRTHQLEATRTSTGWEVSEEQLARFVAARDADRCTPDGSSSGPRRRVDWRGRLRVALERGDEVAAWRVLSEAMRSGVDAEACYLDVLAGALADLGADVDEPDDDHLGSYLAAAVATRLVARLGARLRRPGRPRGTIVLGAPRGEQHGLSIAILADLIRTRGFECIELGVDVPPDVFAAAVGRVRAPSVVALSVSQAATLEAVEATVDALRAATPDLPVLVGGPGVLNDEVAAAVGADLWAPDIRSALDLLSSGAPTRRPAEVDVEPTRA